MRLILEFETSGSEYVVTAKTFSGKKLLQEFFSEAYNC